jgi:hypothetical protein
MLHEGKAGWCCSGDETVRLARLGLSQLVFVTEKYSVQAEISLAVCK